MTIDALTKRWLRNKSDIFAADNGCTFDEERASHAVWWIERFCKLYEGEQAGEPLILRGCHQCYKPPTTPEEWGTEEEPGRWNAATKAIYVKRAAAHNKCVAAGHEIDWQYECVMRIFGWVRFNKKWDRMVRRFREAVIFVAKKCKKSPSLAAMLLYLFCADGEPGQKVFVCAKDGKQAREIAGKHVIEMFRQCPELQAQCSLNQTLMQLTHEKSRSILLPLSSSNERTMQAKEGINGCVGIDEIHVVDREYVGRISRAGISRSEPMQIEVSTAGDNPDGYGKERFDLAVQVISGEAKRQELFAAIYAAPQGLTDEQLATDPLKYARMANPAMGHTVDPEEFMRDYENSKPSLTEFGRFKKYRLNIWQHSANPWIRQDDWVKGRQSYTEEDLIGLPCIAGLDLSKVWDLTCLMLVFPWEDGIRLWPYFFMPEETARLRNDKVSFLQWAKDGHIVLCPGNSLEYGFVVDQFAKAAEKFNIGEVVYDAWRADDTTLKMSEGMAGPDGETIIAGTGVPRLVFPQTISSFASPCQEFERLVVAGQLYHPDHPVLNWQAGHVTVKSDMNRNVRPVKPKPGDIKSIDGIVAALMGLSRVSILATCGGGVEVW